MTEDDPDQRPHQREHHHGQALGVDARQFGRFGIAAGCVDVTAEAGARGEEGHAEADDQRDENRDRVARLVAEAISAGHHLVARHAYRLAVGIGGSRRDRDVVVERITLGNLGGPEIGVDHRSRSKRHRGAHQGDEAFRPDRAKREVEAHALPAAVKNAEDDADTGREAERPAPERSDRGAGAAAADQLEGVVHGRHGHAAGDEECEAAEGDQSAQCHDEGRDLAIGDQQAVETADRRAHHDGENDRRDPDRWMADTQHRAKLVDL